MFLFAFAATAEQGQANVVFDMDKHTVMLNNGYEMPIIGLGTWTLSNGQAEESVYAALNDLGIDYIDLMLIHQPGWNDEAVYSALEDAVAAGKVRSIGISNY